MEWTTLTPADRPFNLSSRLYLRPADVAQALSCSVETVFRRLRDETLPSVKIGRLRLIPRSALEALIFS
jgi:excisionase family DNA binding protein